MPKPSVYVETTVISVLTSRPSRDIVQMALQQLTREWWETRSGGFELFVSDFVLREASRGDRDAAKKRLEVTSRFTELAVTPTVAKLAAHLLKETRLPAKAQLDAAHLACAAIHRMEFLVTWGLHPYRQCRVDAADSGSMSKGWSQVPTDLHSARVNDDAMKTKQPKKAYSTDPIVEVRQIREELGAEHDYDIQAICDAARRRQKASGRRVIDRSSSEPVASA